MRNMNVQKIVNSVVRPLKKFNSAIPASFTAPLVLALLYLLKEQDQIGVCRHFDRPLYVKVPNIQSKTHAR